MNRAGSYERFAELTDYLAAQVTEASINIAPEFDPKKLFAQVTAPVVEEILGAALTGRLSEADAVTVASIMKSGHAFCSLCVLVITTWEAGEDLALELRNKGADLIVDMLFGVVGSSIMDAAAKGVVRGALLAGFDAAWEALKATAQIELTLKSLRLLGLITCPNIDTHQSDEVTVHCLIPLATELLSEVFTRWIESRFVGKISVQSQNTAQLS